MERAKVQYGRFGACWTRVLDPLQGRCIQILVKSRHVVVLLGVIVLSALLIHVHQVFYNISTERDPSHSYIPSLHSHTELEELYAKEELDDDITRKPKHHKPRLKILVMSYMRSGSTLCADILQVHPETFYVYEPLLYLWDYYIPEKDVRNVHIRRRAKHHWRTTKPYLPQPFEFLTYMFNCNLTKYNLEFLTNVAHSHAFTTVGCETKKEFLHSLVNLTQQCVQGVSDRCHNSKTIIQKVVRLTMEEADIYLEKDPTLKIIHLVRDPRGILLSRMHFNNKTVGEMHNNYTNVCQRIWEDINVSRMIAHKHSDKILTIRYEDLAQDPLYITAAMYSFVGLELIPSVRDYVHRITSSEALREDGKVAAKKTARKNPLLTAYHWRLELPYSLVQKVDKACRNVLQALGYITFPEEVQLRDLNIPAKREIYGEGLMTPWSMGKEHID